MNRHFPKILVFLILILIVANCAKRGRPTGGDIDEIPPVMENASPKNKSVNFNAKKIKINFDEYVKLKDVSTQLIVSPPLKYNPIITPLGTASKFISIKILDTLKENTTYSINFGNSVVDNNEGNALESFKYVFSTGSYVDSLKISGNSYDAFNQESDEDVLIMLYEIDSVYTDSIIYKEKPMYVSSTLDSTIFELTNLKEGKFQAIAIKQQNKDYIYKPKQDKIGFLKEIISLPHDTTFTISLFKEILPFEFFRGSEIAKGHIIFSYEGKKDSLKLRLLDKMSDEFKSEMVFEKGKDTLNYWFNEIEKDSLLFEISNLEFIDTVSVKLKLEKQDTLVIKNNIGSVINLKDTFSISSTIPISNIDISKITVHDIDTVAVSFDTKIDVYKNNLFINFDKKYKNQYKIDLLPNAINDVFGNTNDTISYTVKTKTLEDYGVINLQISNVNSPVIIEMIDEKGEIYAIEKIKTNKTLSFQNLDPKTYLFRAIYDDNDNGKWDTGDFLNRIYPEKVIYFETPLELRANWELNETFTLE